LSCIQETILWPIRLAKQESKQVTETPCLFCTSTSFFTILSNVRLFQHIYFEPTTTLNYNLVRDILWALDQIF